MKLVFATHNAHKWKEVSALLPRVEVLSLGDIDCTEELPETSDTFQGNAAQKAQYIYDKYGVNCFADDSGLEVAALGGSPGIYSARYAGTLQPGDNMARLLHEMRDTNDRSACFKTVLVSIIDGEQRAFEGLLKGTLTRETRGRQGFGYDPVFLPEGHTATLAEMSPEEKNAISHRADACRKFAGYLDALAQTPKTTHGSIR